MDNNTFFVESFEAIEHNSKNIGYVFHGSRFIKPFFIKPLDVWEHTLQTCSGCNNNFEIVIMQRQKELEKFPNCCIQHKELANQSWFKRIDFESIPQQYAEKLFYSWFQILHFSDSENWRIEIFDYLEYAIKSFGAFPNDYGEPLYLSQYLSQLKAIIENSFKTIYSKDISKEELLKRLKEIIEYLDKVGKVDENYKPTNLNLLIETYNKWFKIFPFEISFFSTLKPHFEKQLPILNGKPETNKYTGLAKVKMHTKGSLIDVLLNLTNNLLTQINTTALYEKGLLTEPQKIKLELVLNERKMKLKQGYVNSSKDEEQRYRKILKEWFADEKRFIDEVTPIVKALPPQPIKTKADKLKEQLSQYGFFELEKVKTLSEQSKVLIIEKIAESSLPYAIAMFDYLQFIPYLEKKHFDSKYKLNREVSKWFDSDKDGRAVKGNISSLLKNTTENKDRYTAYKHKKNVINDYEQLI